MSEEKKDGVRKDGDRPRRSKTKSAEVVSGGPGVIVFPVTPGMAAMLRKRQEEDRARAEREAAGETTGGTDSGEETTTNE